MTDIKAAAENKLLKEMCQSSLLFIIPNPKLVPQKSQRSQEAKEQLFLMLQQCRHRQRENTRTDLHPGQVIATLCTTLTCALPPLAVNSRLKTSFQAAWTEGKPHPLPGDVLLAGAGTDTARFLSTRASPLILLCSQILFLSGLTHR